MAGSPLLAEIAGYFAASSGGVRLVGSLAHRVPATKHVAFVADLWAHLTAYGVSFFWRDWRAHLGFVLAVEIGEGCSKIAIIWSVDPILKPEVCHETFLSH